MVRSDTGYRVAHLERARVFHVPGDEGSARTTHAAFLAGVDRARKFLGAPGEFPLANLFLLPSRAEFDRFVTHLTPTPTSPSRVGQPQGHDLYLLSPTAYPTDASPDWLGPDGLLDATMFERLVAHEAVHMVEERLSPPAAMENRPAWWSEGLAVLISGQHQHDRDVREHLAEDLATGAIPGLDEMDGGPAYTWGWTVVERICDVCGQEAVLGMITGTSGADVVTSLGLERTRFESEWLARAPDLARKALA